MAYATCTHQTMSWSRGKYDARHGCKLSKGLGSSAKDFNLSMVRRMRVTKVRFEMRVGLEDAIF